MAEVIYKETDYYDPEFERILLWNDSDVGVKWPYGAVISAKDIYGVTLKNADIFEDM